ncbi:exosortase family protein XrtF [Algibacter lectus]|uniref:exosortase family protein XrtF n=1 Tax=Algibacter lectus TaxID=221126 RepID=UPI0026F1E8C6|nr:exosortase family protein XrtF [Algibacter lectus]MDO7137871.1 exosortase family protein XrtF [Algibacter lectus]
MKTLFIKYRSVIKFILTFLLVYLSLSVIYKFYLQFSDGSEFYPDYFTHLVGEQSKDLLNTFGYATKMVPHLEEPSLKVMIGNIYVARVIEGCNGLSVLILFISFIVAFSGRLKATLLYLLSGSVIIYVVNVLRIVILSIWLYKYPEQSEFLHAVVFPAIIYGVVFLLWIFWVNRFSKLNQKNV